MKKSNILIAVFTVTLAAVSAAKAEIGIDFDGKTGRAVNFADELKDNDAKAVPVPQKADMAAAFKPGLSNKIYSEDGVQKKNLQVKYYVQVKAAGADSKDLWAVGKDSKVYALGMARTSPEFASPNKLAAAISPFGRATGAADSRYSCRNGCHDSTTYVCVNGRANECVITQCGECYVNSDHECDCNWDTTSSPHGCTDTGNPCNN